MEENFAKFISLVWPENGDFDSPKGGYHVTPGDSGGGTKGGVIEATWQHYKAAGLVSGSLAAASDAQLETVLRAAAWGATGDSLPAGLDILIANGKMMTGRYQALVEQCLGFIGSEVDNAIGPNDLKAIAASDAKTLISAIHGTHYQYLRSLSSWHEFANGWTRRLIAAYQVALATV